MEHNYKNFENELCVSYNCKLLFWQDGANDKIKNIETWLRDLVGEDNFIFGFEDYGQHGEYMLYTRSRADLLAFKIRWCDA
jgi:hypothetical protein